MFKNLKIAGIATACFFMSSCLFFKDPEEKPDVVNEGRFIVGDITTPEPYDPIEPLKKNGLNYAFILNLKTCLKDSLRPDSSIEQGHPFIIEYETNLGGGLKTTEVLTNENGCIQWEERYKYEYYLKSTWIGLRRTIRQGKRGSYPGAVEVPLAVNPWLANEEKRPPFIDTRPDRSADSHILKIEGNYKEKGLEFLSVLAKSDKKAEANKPFLWAPVISSLQVIEKSREIQDQDGIKAYLNQFETPCEENDKECYFRNFEFEMRIPLKFKSLSSLGIPFNTELSGGRYNLKSFLIIQPKGGAKEESYTLDECKEEAELTSEGELEIKCIFKISHFNENSVFKLALRIQSVDEKLLPLRAFEGVYTVGFDSGNEQNRNTKIDASDDKAYENILKNPAEKLTIIKDLNLKNILKASTDKGISSDLLRLGVTSVDFKFSDIKAGEDTVERTVNFVGRVCLNDPLNSQKLAFKEFQIFLESPCRKEDCSPEERIKEKFKTGKEKFKTDADQCITLPIPIEHKLYDRQKYFENVLYIVSKDLNVYSKTTLALNPWQRAFQAFQNAEQLAKDSIRFDAGEIPKPELVINEFRAINLFPSYGLDKLLNIHLFHRFYLLFQPFIRRPDNVGLGLNFKSRELLRDGYYLVRVIVLRNPKETNTKGWRAALHQHILDKKREEEVNIQEFVDLTGAKYLTHTDSIVKARANFINFFMPIHLSNSQFYYVASRNIVVIEVYPADPNHIKYKEDGSLDANRTKWLAYNDHELINKPYGGAINIQNWTNWNLLQPAKINTDQLIESSKTGKKYKHFDLYGNTQNLEKNKKTDPEIRSPDIAGADAINEGSQTDIDYFKSKLVDKEDLKLFDAKNIVKTSADQEGFKPAIAPNQMYSGRLRSIVDQDIQVGQSRIILDQVVENIEQENPENLNEQKSLELSLEQSKEEMKSFDPEEILKNYSLENDLKIISMDTDSGDEFIKKLYLSYKSHLKEQINDSSKREQILRDVLKEHVEWLEGKAHYPLALNMPLYIDTLRSDLSNCSNHQLCSSIFISYMNMLNIYSKSDDFLSAVLNFIDSNKNLFSKESIVKQCSRECQFNQILKAISGFQLVNFVSYKEQLLDDSRNEDSLYHYKDIPDNLIKSNTFIYMLSYLISLVDKAHLPKREAELRNSFEGNYLEILKEGLEKNRQNLLNYEKHHIQSVRTYAEVEWGRIFKKNSEEFFHNRQIPEEAINFLNKENLEKMIDEGLSFKNTSAHPVFTKGLCRFWMEHFVKESSEDLRISSYMNYIKDFNYLEHLEHSSMKNENDINKLEEEMQSYLSFMNQNILNGEKTCHEDYRACVEEHFCFNAPSEENLVKARYCENQKRPSCYNWVQKRCKEDPKNELCDNPDLEETCLEEVNLFCKSSPDDSLCHTKNNRCMLEYRQCLNGKESLFQLNSIDSLFDTEPLMKNCVQEFNRFFKLENKVIVHDISSEEDSLRYKGGRLRNFGITINNSIGSYMNWTAQRGRSLSLSLSGGPGIDPFGNIKINNKIFRIFSLGLGLSGKIEQAQSSNESNSGRRAWDARGGDGIYLSVGEAEFEIGLKRFQKCLVIKPRSPSFFVDISKLEPKLYKKVWKDSANNIEKALISRPGLMLCNPPTEEKESIAETYYYVSQANTDPSNSQFLDLYDLKNRPFIIILRGSREFLKFYDSIRTINGMSMNKKPDNMFMKYIDIADHTSGVTLNLRDTGDTGFYEGIYDIPIGIQEELVEIHNTNDDKELLNRLHRWTLFNVPNTYDKVIHIQK